MKIEKKTPSINNDDLIKQEQYLECKFPEDYREFLLEYNGGIPSKNILSFIEKNNKTEDYIDIFFGICDDDIYGLKSNNNSYINRIPSNTIAIACDPGGNLFLISIRGEDYGQIYFWDHEEEVDWNSDQEADYSNLTPVAKSFTDLINNLKDISELDDK
jgi:hypothetical protein